MAQYKGTSADGNRARFGAKRREAEKSEFERQKQELQEFGQEGLKSLDAQFKKQDTHLDRQFKQDTVGYKTAEEYKKIQQDRELKIQEKLKQREKELKKRKKQRKRQQEEMATTLSFAGDDEEEEEEEEHEIQEAPKPAKKKMKKLKNPDVDTSFLPDRERDEKEALERKRLETEWDERQKEIKKERIEITYSYWDGSGHRRVITVEKGYRINQFLEACRMDLQRQFSEMRGILSENLMYIKEDLIIPQSYTFYDLIVSKARGKSGPLFHFDVHDDVRMLADATVEKDESHAGKVITRAWYERNKHIFPASRWEVYDPSVTRNKYTIS